MKKSILPETDSITELAAYWDTHDLTDHENELEEVTNPFETRTVVEIPLDGAQMANAQRIADSRGITLPTIIQLRVGEHLGS